MKRYQTLLGVMAVALATAMPVQAQDLSFGGAVLNHDIMMSTDFAQLSQAHSFGTARFMAMGGAFTSLGADLSAMSQNPAGLGMYRRNEISLTPMLSLSNANTPGTQTWQKNNKTQFAFSNIAAALNVYESSTSQMTSLTIGFGMNRIADFNTRYSYSSESRYNPSNPTHLMPTIADLFGRQLGQAGIFPAENSSELNGTLNYGDINPYFWPAALGYNGYMISTYQDADGKFWAPDLIGRNASVLHSMDVVNSGSINEFAFSVGGNVNNIFYFGATIGIQSVHKKTGVTYQEEYGYFDANGQPTQAIYADGSPLATQLDYSNLYQQTVIDGSGVNMKLGFIVRPTENIRLGIAFHTPTYYSLSRSYRGSIETQRYENDTQQTAIMKDDTPTITDEERNSWDFASPSRLMLGASYTLGNFAILSVDYERDWYNGIRVKNLPEGLGISTEEYKEEFKNNYQATNTLRAGLEVRPLPTVALRVGGGYTGSMLKDKSAYYNTPSTWESYYFSAGVGFTLSKTTVIDLAYQNVTNHQTAYQLFFAQDANTGEMVTESGLYNTNLTRHYIALTLGFRF